MDEVESQAYFESLEGSLVSVAGSALVVGPTTRYGEYAIVLPKHDLIPRLAGPGPGHVDPR